jgi:hypothetical protein
MPKHFNKDEEEPIRSMYAITGGEGDQPYWLPSHAYGPHDVQGQGNDTSNIISRAGRELSYKVESDI